jgi:7-cyano-7-deazaguanine synthase
MTNRVTMISWPPKSATTPLAVLASGGLDSAVLLGEAVHGYPRVIPIFVRVGSIWENAELDSLNRFCHALHAKNLDAIIELNQPVADLYGPHWSLTGVGVPMRGEPDEASFLPGRNVLLFAKPLLYCLMNGIPELATAPLGSNPFPDATAEFYEGLAKTTGLALNRQVKILRPYADLKLHKDDVIRRGAGMPLSETLSCAKPVQNRNCGLCSKCGERIDGFAAAGVADPTIYATDLRNTKTR